jgi:hypothetical protein
MIVFNFCGEPSSGKTTAAPDLFCTFKRAGHEAELVGETARDYIYLQGKAPLFDNQLLIGGQQWERLYRLYRSGVEIAVSDSPLMQGMLYARHHIYFDELRATLQKANDFFPHTYNIFLKRNWPYVAKNRNQTEEEALALIPFARELVGPIWREVNGDEEGLALLKRDALALVRKILGR